MKGVEVHDLAAEELQDKLRDLREELFNLRFQHATGQLDNHARMRLVKKDIARVKTVIRELELEELENAPPPAAAEEPEATPESTDE